MVIRSQRAVAQISALRVLAIRSLKYLCVDRDPNSGDTLPIFLFMSRFLRFKLSAQKEFHCSDKGIGNGNRKMTHRGSPNLTHPSIKKSAPILLFTAERIPE